MEDLPWFPAVIRDLATDYIHFLQTRLALNESAVDLLAGALQATGLRAIVDLGSGGGGPAPAVRSALAGRGLDVHVTLTDRYPNLEAFRRLATGSAGGIAYVAEPVDARSVPRALEGLRTLFNAFHHFRPEDAREILSDAVRAGRPIAIFELSDRSLRTLLPMLFLTPLMVLLATPWVRPFLCRRLLWTYVVPLVPLTCWWDGIVSQLRAYTPTELLSLGQAASGDGYRWDAGAVPIGSAPGRLTYLIGLPGESP